MLDEKKNNKIYYHYCSVDTFYNILQTGTIRFGNPLNMNDSAEIIWLLEMVKDFVLKRGIYNSILEGWNLIENISRTNGLSLYFLFIEGQGRPELMAIICK